MSQLISQIKFGNLTFFSLPFTAQRAILHKDKSVPKEYKNLLFKCLKDGWYYHAIELWPNLQYWNEKHDFLSIRICNNLSVAAQVADSTGTHQREIYESLIEFTMSVTQELVRFDSLTADDEAINDNFLIEQVNPEPKLSVPSYPNCLPSVPVNQASQQYVSGFTYSTPVQVNYQYPQNPKSNSFSASGQKTVDPTSHLLYSVALPSQQSIRDIDHTTLIIDICRHHYSDNSKNWKTAVQQCYINSFVFTEYRRDMRMEDYLVVRFNNSLGRGFVCFEIRNSYATLVSSSCDVTNGNIYLSDSYCKIGNIMLKPNKAATIAGVSSCWIDITIVKK